MLNTMKFLMNGMGKKNVMILYKTREKAIKKYYDIRNEIPHCMIADESGCGFPPSLEFTQGGNIVVKSAIDNDVECYMEDMDILYVERTISAELIEKIIFNEKGNFDGRVYYF